MVTICAQRIDRLRGQAFQREPGHLLLYLRVGTLRFGQPRQHARGQSP